MYMMIPQNDLANDEKIILCVNARDEKNIKEWVAHHLLLGFDEIHICDHKSIIPLDGQFDKFNIEIENETPENTEKPEKKRVFVRRSDVDGPVKELFIQQAVQQAVDRNVQWMLYLDADEFLVFNSEVKTVHEFMKKFKDYDLVALSWLMFGSNGHEKEPDGFIIDNYTKSQLKLCNHIKSFLRPDQFEKPNCHKCTIKHYTRAIHINGSVLNPHSVLFENNINYSDSEAYIAHYYVQSKETYLRRKLTLPRDDDGTQGVNANREEYYSLNHLNEVDNYSIRNKYSEQIRLYLGSIGEL
jgi:hypothetical protein